MKNYTHIAKIYGFKCYFNENTGEIEGVNWIENKLIELFVWIDVTFTSNDAFKIEILEKL
ncbi:hypothetical protein HDF19_11990 [Mucilaginibacter sp. E4BP6]|uniref:hypothetical protein n=1 Tax=Mucilaginibacter sp. E4BP6 TaxID=2723089 RepID=UPI0017E8176B|nr:hypothetical protein [Mucilaginibacter sp. E4BP6]